MPQKIVFFVQTTKPIGGSQVLFLDLASYIAKNYERDYELYYINHANPLINELYGDANIHILDVNSCDYSQFDDAIFFTPFNYIFYLMAKIKHVQNARICLYFYHPQIMDWLKMQIGRKNANLNPLLQLLKQTDSYCFMDSSNYVALEKLTDVDFAKRYVPVAIHEEFQPYFSPVPYVNSDILNIGWLGRLDRD